MPLREFPKRIKCGDDWQAAMLLEKVAPAAHEGAGTVELRIVVGHDGGVMEVLPVSGPEELLEPAISAVKQWLFRPTTLNGRPIEVQSTVRLCFS